MRQLKANLKDEAQLRLRMEEGDAREEMKGEGGRGLYWLSRCAGQIRTEAERGFIWDQPPFPSAAVCLGNPPFSLLRLRVPSLAHFHSKTW